MATFSVLYSEDYVLTGINLNLLDLDITIIDMFYNALHKRLSKRILSVLYYLWIGILLNIILLLTKNFTQNIQIIAYLQLFKKNGH